MCVAAASPRWRSCNDADEWDPKVDCATVASDTTMTRKVRVIRALPGLQKYSMFDSARDGDMVIW